MCREGNIEADFLVNEGAPKTRVGRIKTTLLMQLGDLVSADQNCCFFTRRVRK